jgi:nicotinate-nucleotide--dimethylbenzimidazole phosphoribosyltransferase
MPTHPVPPAGEQPFERIPTGDAELERALLQRLRVQTKPPGALGLLERTGVRLGLLQKTVFPKAETFRVCVFAGSHGITARGVSAYPAEVTAQMVGNFLAGGAAICVLARAAGASLHVIDTGVDAPDAAWPAQGATFFQRAARSGTRCFSREPAMSAQECDTAMEAGREQVRLALADGIDVLAIGEMGIGNTTSAAALCAALLPAPATAVTGRGTGVDDAGLVRKVQVIEKALETYAVKLHDKTSARHWLECVGGYEIAAMAGRRSRPAAARGWVHRLGSRSGGRTHEPGRSGLLLFCTPVRGNRTCLAARENGRYPPAPPGTAPWGGHGRSFGISAAAGGGAAAFRDGDL